MSDLTAATIDEGSVMRIEDSALRCPDKIEDRFPRQERRNGNLSRN